MNTPDLHPFELLKPPLYWRAPGSGMQRIHAPNAARRAELRQIVFTRDGFCCVECGRQFEAPRDYDGIRSIDGLTLGHIINYRDGGPYVPENLHAECRDCNLAKAHMAPKGTATRTHLTGRGDGAYAADLHEPPDPNPHADECSGDNADEWARDLADNDDITFDNQETP